MTRRSSGAALRRDRLFRRKTPATDTAHPTSDIRMHCPTRTRGPLRSLRRMAQAPRRRGCRSARLAARARARGRAGRLQGRGSPASGCARTGSSSRSSPSFRAANPSSSTRSSSPISERGSCRRPRAARRCARPSSSSIRRARRRFSCCRSRRASRTRRSQEFRQLRRRMGDVSARPVRRRQDERGARPRLRGRSACRSRSPGRSACRMTPTRHPPILCATATSASTSRAWRHAIINFPHPLLQQGLVILDTPGLNAIGAEPELTLNLLPSAQVVLFVLAADAGVTKSDLDVWRRDLAGDDPAQKAARLVVLNKIDSLWDELKPEAAVAAEIGRQVEASAALLGLPPTQVFPVSAQKGLLAKVNGDDALLERSRLPALEDALSREAHPGEARHRGRGDASRRSARSPQTCASVLEARQIEHRRAARRSARIARQESGRRRAHDDARQRGQGALRARRAAVRRAAHGVRPADERAVRRHRARGACARTRGARAAASSAARSRRASAARWRISSRRSAGISTTPDAARSRSTT